MTDDTNRDLQMPNMQGFGGSSAYFDLKARIQAKLLSKLDLSMDVNSPEGRKNIEALFNTIVADENIVLARAEKTRLLEQIIADIQDEGFGPLEPLLRDPTTVEIMVERFDQIYVERGGKVENSGQRFRDEAHLMQIIEKIATPMGRRVDESHPIVDLRLSDGSRVNVVIPPISLNGTVMNIRKFTGKEVTPEELIASGSCSQPIFDFLTTCVRNRLNIVVSGGAGAGKTTLLNLLAGAIPDDERIIALQFAGELHLHQPRVIHLETRPANLEGKGEVSMRDLVINSLKMRPDRIIVGEVHDGEALDLFAAITTGHDGTLFSMHSAGPRDTLARLEVMAQMGNPAVPILTIRESMTASVNIIVHCDVLRDGSRKVMKVTEVVGMEGGVVGMQDIFEYKMVVGDDGKMAAHFTATGLIPSFLDRIPGIRDEFPEDMFQPHS